MIKLILTSLVLSATVVPFVSNANQVAEVTLGAIPLSIVIDRPAPSLPATAQIKVQAKHNLLTDTLNPQRHSNQQLAKQFVDSDNSVSNAE